MSVRPARRGGRRARASCRGCCCDVTGPAVRALLGGSSGDATTTVAALPCQEGHGERAAGCAGARRARGRPVAAPLVALLLVLVVDAVAPAAGRRAGTCTTSLALAGLLAAGAAVVALAADGADRRTACVPGGGLQLSACSYVISPLTLALQGVTLAAALVCLLLAVDGPGARDRTPHHVLLLAAVAGATALAGARDLATLVVALETASLPAVGLVALRRDPRGRRRAVTFLLTALSSLGLLLLGSALVLAATGSAAPRPDRHRARRTRACPRGCEPSPCSACSSPSRGSPSSSRGAVPPLDAGHLRRRPAAGRGVPGDRVQGRPRPRRSSSCSSSASPPLAASWAPVARRWSPP